MKAKLFVFNVQGRLTVTTSVEDSNFYKRPFIKTIPHTKGGSVKAYTGFEGEFQRASAVKEVTLW